MSAERSAATASTANGASPPIVLDAVIIGAGWAGLGAANALHSRNRKRKNSPPIKFLLLESRNRIGGRSYTSRRFGPNTPVELGSAWVMGVGGYNPPHGSNPIGDMLDMYGVPYVTSNVDNSKYYAVWDEEGRRMDADRNNNDNVGADTDVFTDNEESATNKRGRGKRLKRLEWLKNMFLLYAKMRRAIDFKKDSTLGSALDDFIRKTPGLVPGGSDDIGLRNLLHWEIAQEYAADLNELSLRYFDMDDEIPGGEDCYLAVGGGGKGGYSEVVARYAAPVMDRVTLGTKVTRVEYMQYGSTMCKVCRVDATTGEEQRPILARHVIVTLPLGVLQAGTVQFSPELPKAKLDSIRSLGSGLANKVALYWDGMTSSEVFWPKEKELLLRMAPVPAGGAGEQGLFFTEWHSPYVINGGRPLLVAYVVGSQALLLEQMTDEEVVAKAVQSLRDMFGQNRVPPPTDFVVTRWGSDPHSRGSYSYQRIGSAAQSRRHLVAPVAGCIWFAGEATSRGYPSTTHGALATGVDAGRKVASEMGETRAGMLRRSLTSRLSSRSVSQGSNV